MVTADGPRRTTLKFEIEILYFFGPFGLTKVDISAEMEALIDLSQSQNSNFKSNFFFKKLALTTKYHASSLTFDLHYPSGWIFYRVLYCKKLKQNWNFELKISLEFPHVVLACEINLSRRGRAV